MNADGIAARRHAALIATQLAVSRCGGDLQAAFRCVVERAGEIVPACELAVIEVVEGTELVYRSAAPTGSIGTRLRLAGSASGLCLSLGRPLRVDDTETDDRVDRAACRANAIRSMVLVPIAPEATTIGVLKLACSRPQGFVEEDVLLGQLLVGIVSAGLSNAGENQAREALASSEAFNRGILQSSGDRIEVLFLDGRIETINQAGLALQGLETDSAIIGTNWVEGWPRESREDAAAAIAAAGAGQVGRLRGWGLSSARPAMETAAGTARESRRWWDVVVTPIPGADGEPRRLLSMARDMTELQDARERTELALQAGAVMGIVTWEAGILSVDDRLARAFELSGEAAWQDIAPAEFLARVHPEDRDTLCDLGRRSLLTKSELRAPFRLRVQGERPGVWRWVEARGLVTGGANGRLVRLTGVLIDIDARKRAELELAQNEENVRQIADSLPILIAFISPELTYRFANRAYGDWFGKEPGRIVGRPIRRLLGEPIEEGPRLPLERALAGQATRFDAQIRHRNGSLRDVEIGYVPRRGGDGEVDGCYVIGIDITRRKEEERALSRSNLTLEHSLAMVQQESEQVWRLSRDLLCVLDSDGSLRSFNPAWVAALGWSGEDLLRRRYPEFLHPDDVERTTETVAAMAESGGMSGFENRWRSRDGSYRWLSWNAVLADGLIYAAARDVTAEKESTLRLQRTEEQLRQSQKMEAVGQLTGGIAHDFNNLLTGVIGSIEMMRNRVKQGRAGELERYMDAAAGAAERAAALTHRLLAFSRRQTLDPKPVAADELVAGMEELIRRTGGPAATLQIVRHPGLWAIFCDPRQLESALLNLANNARDAMPNGGRLVIETANTVLEDSEADSEIPAGDYVALSVTDTGSGMSAAVAARAFDPFFTTKPMGRGTGLGLSMVYGFARQSGGHARIVSTPGHGARVTIYLPRHRNADEVRLDPGNAVTPMRSGRAVLLVEDEPMVRMLVGEALAELGCDTVEAVDGAGGLRVIQGGTPVDLLITDVGLPGGMNGRQMAEAARLRRPDLKVLFITGYAEAAVFGEGFGNAAMQVIEKPFTMELLMDRVRSMMWL